MTTAENLLKGDVWSDDGGETWWEVITNEHEPDYDDCYDEVYGDGYDSFYD